MTNCEKVKNDRVKADEFESKNAGRKTAIEELNKNFQLFHFLQNLTENPNFFLHVSILKQPVLEFFLEIPVQKSKEIQFSKTYPKYFKVKTKFFITRFLPELKMQPFKFKLTFAKEQKLTKD